MDDSGKELIRGSIPDFLKKKHSKKIHLGEKYLKSKDYDKFNVNLHFYKKNPAIKKCAVNVWLINDTESIKSIPVPLYGRIISDVYQIKYELTGTASLDGAIDVKILPNDKLTDEYTYPVVRRSSEEPWAMLEHYTQSSDGVRVTCTNDMMITLIKEVANEKIVIPKNGGMIYSKLNKTFCLRVPKGNFKDDVFCKYQTIPVSNELRDEYSPIYCQPFQGIEYYSEIVCIDIIDNNGCRVLSHGDGGQLRRTVTVKIPLPQWVIDQLSMNQTIDFKIPIRNQLKETPGFLLMKEDAVNNTWNLVETGLLYTENSVSFEANNFGRFMYVKCRQNREMRLSANVSLITELFECTRGVILPFLHVCAPESASSSTGRISLWFELAAVSEIESIRKRLEKEGLVFLQPVFEFRSNSDENKMKNNRKKEKSENEELRRLSFEVRENIQIRIKVSGELVRRDEKEGAIEKYKENLAKMTEEDEEEQSGNLDGVLNIGSRGRVQKRRKLRWDDETGEEEGAMAMEEEEIDCADLIYKGSLKCALCVALELVPRQLGSYSDNVETELAAWHQVVLKKFDKEKTLQSNGFHKEGPICVPNGDNVHHDIQPDLLKASSDQYNYHLSNHLADTEHNTDFPVTISYQVKYPNTTSTTTNSPIMTFPKQLVNIYIPARLMKQYFNVLSMEEKEAIREKKKEEEEKERLLKEEKERLAHEAKKQASVPKNQKSMSQNRINGLARPRVINKLIEREPKVISRRSLTALATVVRQGLTLGVYLGLPDALIAGIGFDSLSQLSNQNQSSNSLTYKVLVIWKRSCMINKMSESEYIDQLSRGLSDLGFDSLAQLVVYCWENKREISVEDCQRCLLEKNFSLNNAY